MCVREICVCERGREGGIERVIERERVCERDRQREIVRENRHRMTNKNQI